MLAGAGVDLRVYASRRLTIHGIRYDLRLDVFPRDGFDDFAWAAFVRPWLGSTRPVDDVEWKVNQVLDSYAAGGIPPGSGFE